MGWFTPSSNLYLGDTWNLFDDVRLTLVKVTVFVKHFTRNAQLTRMLHLVLMCRQVHSFDTHCFLTNIFLNFSI